MKNYIVLGALALVFIIQPNFALASPLTNSQAESLISVVQSSPDTPASAFVNLITVFSNITNTQAESLISVVQSSPNTPANAFVDFLIAFTVDPVDSPVLGALQTQVTNLTNQIKIMTDVKTQVEVPVVDRSELVVTANTPSKKDPENNVPYGEFSFFVSVLDKDGNHTEGALVTPTYPSDNLYTQLGKTGLGQDAGAKKTTNRSNADIKDWNAGFTYHPTTVGTKTITFTSGSLTKSVTVEVQ